MTLDGVERALDPADLLICDGNDVADRHRRRHGRRVAPRSTTPRPTVALEMAWFDPPTIAATAGRLGTAIRGVGPLRAGRRPRGRRPRRAPLRRAAPARRVPTRSSTARSTRAGDCLARPPVPLRLGAGERVCSALTLTIDDITRAASADRVRGRARSDRRHRAGRRSRRGATTARPRSTSSRRSPASTATRASSRPCRSRRIRRARARPAGPAPAARGRGRAGRVRGDAEPVPRSRRPRPRGPRADGHLDHEPARDRGVGAAHVAAARAAQGGRLQRVAPQRRRRAVRDRPRVPAAATRRAAARRARDPRRRPRGARGAGGAGAVWDEVAAALWTGATCLSPRGSGPGCTPPATLLLGEDGALGAVGEVDPACSTPTASASGSRGSSSSSTALFARPTSPSAGTGRSAASRRPTSTWPSGR